MVSINNLKRIEIAIGIALLVVVSGCLSYGTSTVITVIPQDHIRVIQQQSTASLDQVLVTIGIEKEKPKFLAVLWPYKGDCTSSGFSGPCDPQSYIIPQNEVVQYFSSVLDIDNHGALVWKDNPWNYSGVFSNIYISDQDQFGKEDYWANPNWYLMNGMKGDCEDSALAVASIFEAKGIRSKVVGGNLFSEGEWKKDWMVEYKINGVYYRYFGGDPKMTSFISRDDFKTFKPIQSIDFGPVIMFDKNSPYQQYYENW